MPKSPKRVRKVILLLDEDALVLSTGFVSVRVAATGEWRIPAVLPYTTLQVLISLADAASSDRPIMIEGIGDQILIGGAELALAPEDYVLVGAPVQPGFDAPRLSLRSGRFPKGYGNIEARGLWGYTEDDGSAEGRTPLEIRRVTILLVLRTLPPMGDTDAAGEARNRWRILEERTRDQSYKLDRVAQTGAFTGDPEIDGILARFRRPPGLGAA